MLRITRESPHAEICIDNPAGMRHQTTCTCYVSQGMETKHLREAIKKKIGKILEFVRKGGGVSAKIKKV